MSYQGTWEWEGKTQQSSDTQATSMTTPIDPFPFANVIDACQIAILSETTKAFQEGMAKIGITATINNIVPEVWIETVLYDVRWVGAEHTQEQDFWHHYLHMKATVYFTSDKPLTQSPIDPLTLAALVKVIEYLILVVAGALLIYAIAETFIKSFLVTTQTITTYDPSTGKTTIETITQPSLTGQIITVVGVLGALALGLWFFTNWKKGKRKA